MLQSAFASAGHSSPRRRPDHESSRGRLTGGKVLAILLGAFALIGSVNGLMIYYALTTFRGEVDPHPYEHGLAYNRDIAAAEAQDARHWNVSAHIDGAGMTKTVDAQFRDSANHALTGLAVTVHLEFATDMTRDQKLALTEVAPGLYRGNLRLASGQWDLVIDAKRHGKDLFVSRSRIAVP